MMKEQLGGQLSRPKYELLVRPLGIRGIDADGLHLTISNEVLKGWLLDQYADLLNELASLILGRPTRVTVSVATPAAVSQAASYPTDSNPMLVDAEHEFGSDRGSGMQLERRAPVEETRVRRPLLNPRFTFDSFVVGSNNTFCYSSCLQVAQNPGQSYNPLFIYGGVGLGKTHLMQAIGNEIWRRNNSAHVIYVTSEKFTNDFIEHVRTGRMSDFRYRYRDADVLLIDDIQFLSGKTETQIEFFHTFIHLVEDGKQIVISSDRPPRTLKGMEDRLVSRFSMGLVADVDEPSLETRIAILQKKAEAEQVKLPEEVCTFIAEKVSSNVRELEGSLIRLLAFCDISNNPPTVEVAARVLADFIDTGGFRQELSIKQIISVVSEYFNVSEQLLLSPNRSKRVALARMVVMYLAREYTNLTLSQIGNELGGRDHSTISHGANKIAGEIVEDPYVEQTVTQISRLLK
ncbi:MAG: chromosomal replication initiator protein DnaA [Planctomycetales bacterium]|nr:MAG: chromosomal replication initiator protein DnaA [Planctomycetales bacterium]